MRNYQIPTAAALAIALTCADPHASLDRAKQHESYRQEYLANILSENGMADSRVEVVYLPDDEELSSQNSPLFRTTQFSNGTYRIDAGRKFFDFVQNNCDARAAINHEFRHIAQLDHTAAVQPPQFRNRKLNLTEKQNIDKFLQTYFEIDALYSETLLWDCMSPQYRLEMKEMVKFWEDKLNQKPATTPEIVDYFRKDLAERKPAELK